MKISIYIATQNDYNFPKCKSYVPLIVGKPNYKIESSINDSVGESISSKNRFYCELTGHYWIWKNDNQSDIVGLCHYRRFLWLNNIRRRICKKNFTALSAEVENYLDTCNVEKILTDYDIILPRPYIFSADNIKSQFVRYHGQTNYDLIIDSLQRLYPNYVESAKLTFNQRFEYLANLLITRKELFDAYSEWLFSILQDIENHIDLSDERSFRLLGYIGERLLNLYVFHNKLNVKEVPQIFINANDKEDLYIDLRYIKRRYFAGVLNFEESIRKRFKG